MHKPSRYTKILLQMLSSKLSNIQPYHKDEYECTIKQLGPRIFTIEFSHAFKQIPLHTSSPMKFSVLEIVCSAYFNEVCKLEDKLVIVESEQLVPGTYIYKLSNKKLTRRWMRK